MNREPILIHETYGCPECEARPLGWEVLLRETDEGFEPIDPEETRCVYCGAQGRLAAAYDCQSVEPDEGGT